MGTDEIELLKLQLQRDQADRDFKRETDRDKRDFWKWAIMYVMLGLNPLIDLAGSVIQHRAISSVDKKAETAAVVATELKTKADDIAVGVDAGVKSWRARQTQDPDDMNVANEAVLNAATRQIAK